MMADRQVSEHDQSWAVLAAALMAGLRHALSGLVAQVEHIGPTAVPGLPAEPVISIAARLDATANVSTLMRLATVAGWAFEGDLGDDGGLVFTRHHAGLTVRLHVIGAFQPLWDRLLGVRDTLRADADLAARYSHLVRDQLRYPGAAQQLLAQLAARYGPTEQMPVVHRVRAILFTPAERILLVRRTKPGEPIHWVLPGGGIEPDDASPQDTALREVREETGGHARLHRLIHVAVVAGTAHAIFLGRIDRWDEFARIGPELADPSRGGYHLDELDPRDPAFERELVWPIPTARLLAEHLAAGTDLFTLPDLRDQASLRWEPRPARANNPGGR
ncbi:GrpB family protein [Catellatospora citrea]|uniref:GrpB family protein n=1 Tax=Catellatospora citrea TaxID=53366 RepID=UPI0033D121AB